MTRKFSREFIVRKKKKDAFTIKTDVIIPFIDWLKKCSLDEMSCELAILQEKAKSFNDSVFFNDLTEHQVLLALTSFLIKKETPSCNWTKLILSNSFEKNLTNLYIQYKIKQEKILS